MYTFQSRIRYSEVGMDGNLTLESLLDYFQDCSIFHSEDLGLGIEYLKEHHAAWVLSAWQIVVDRYPHLNEQVVAGTVPYDFKGFMGSRNFWLDTQAGERLAYANSIWSLIDTEKGIPIKPTQDMLEGYVFAKKLDMNYAPRKIAIPKQVSMQEEIVVRPHHLDTNGHVNNGQYVRMAMDYVPEDFQICQLRAEYKKQAVLNDRILPAVAADKEAGCYTICLNGEDGKPYSIIELEGRNR